MTINTKQWATAQAQAALLGCRLLRTDPADGPVIFLLERFGLAQTKQPEQLLEMFNPVHEVQP